MLRFLPVRCRLALGLLVVLCAGPAAVHAQGKSLISVETLTTPFSNFENRLLPLLDGKTTPTAADAKGMDIAAKWFTQRVTDSTVQTKPGDMQKVHKEFHNMIDAAVNARAKNQRFLSQFSEHLVKRHKEVMDLDFNTNRVACVNAAVMLPRLGKIGQESIADYLATLLQDAKKHDAIKLYAAQGLNEFYAARPIAPKSLQDAAVRDREAKRLDALLAFLNRAGSAEKASKEEEAAARFVRLSAVRALAQARVPALSVQGGKVQSPVAYALVRTLAGEAGDKAPAPGLAERYEAAVGLCQLQTKEVPQYQPEPAVYRVGIFLGEFAQKYKEDW